MKGILGRKAGMTQIFTEAGKSLPVTVIEVKPNTVLELKNAEKHGYTSTKLGYEDKKDNKANKAELGIAKKAKTSAKYFIKEIRNMEGYEVGQTIDGSIFEAGEFVDVTGTSKGKGFQGPIKRHGQSRGPMTHGSKSHRVTGSNGPISGTVKKTKKMAGHMGHVQVTAQNLEIVAIDLENNAILVKGSIPGPNKSFVVIKPSIKGLDNAEAHVLVSNIVAEAPVKEEAPVVEEVKTEAPVKEEVKAEAPVKEEAPKAEEVKEAPAKEEKVEEAKVEEKPAEEAPAKEEVKEEAPKAEEKPAEEAKEETSEEKEGE